MPLNIVGFFCEDIREERDDIITIIGILPDNINVNQHDAASKADAQNLSLRSSKVLGNLCFYVRANFDPHAALTRLPFFLTLPDGSRLSAGEIASTTIEKSKAKALEHSLPIAGVTLRAILAGFRFPKNGGLIRLEAEAEGESKLVAVLRINPVSKATSPTEIEQPS